MEKTLKNFTKKHFIDWLQNNVAQSIRDDIGNAIDTYSKLGSGFFAVPRMLFPEIDGLGSYLTGESENTSKNITLYFKEILSQVDNRYEKLAVFITFIFRHGLLHQHSPKKFKYGKRELGWQLEISTNNLPDSVLRKRHLKFEKNLLKINMNLFYKDLLNSIDIFISMVNNKKIKFNLIQKSLHSQYKYLNKTVILKRGRNFISKDDFDFLKGL